MVVPCKSVRTLSREKLPTDNVRRHLRPQRSPRGDSTFGRDLMKAFRPHHGLYGSAPVERVDRCVRSGMCWGRIPLRASLGRSRTRPHGEPGACIGSRGRFQSLGCRRSEQDGCLQRLGRLYGALPRERPDGGHVGPRERRRDGSGTSCEGRIERRGRDDGTVRPGQRGSLERSFQSAVVTHSRRRTAPWMSAEASADPERDQ